MPNPQEVKAEKPTPDLLHIGFWNEHPDHPARKLVDELLATRNQERIDEMISHMDRYWWYEIVRRFLRDEFEFSPTQNEIREGEKALEGERTLKGMLWEEITGVARLVIRGDGDEWVIKKRDLNRILLSRLSVHKGGNT